MNKEQYLAKRKELMEAANSLIGEGKVSEANDKVAEVEKLDKDFEEASKAHANIKALENKITIPQANNKGGENMPVKVIDSTQEVVENVFDTMEYRKAFMNHVVKGAAIPTEFMNVNANTKTTDVGAVIPTTVLEKIIEKLEATGMILPLITRTSFVGGVSIPTSTVKPVATWVAEGVGSDRQNKTTGTISFNYFKLRCAVSVSFETDLMALPVFEATIINNIVEAMTKALEQAIINGTGEGQPKGILAETPATGQAITATPEYDKLVEAEAALPLEYEANALWCMTKKTFMQFLAEKGTDGQPLARVNYGISGKPERTLLGRPVVLCNYVKTYADTLTTGDVWAFLFNFKDYALNTNYNIGLKKYEDNETDDQVTKAIMVADGKVIDKNSLVTLKK